ncbi:MAG: LPS export ABC transporter periplasmic protein LptC [Bdellovibrionales bacterium CG10_big_fil_rev_8_21_14_0_10_45_34]|nr:MAG: LPS export ABC transporter periplasmic protein LptC [Bdellovibrionales bacterium CG10_big_fil_rev_8_21_14_0_10_45_34]
MSAMTKTFRLVLRRVIGIVLWLALFAEVLVFNPRTLENRPPLVPRHDGVRDKAEQEMEGVYLVEIGENSRQWELWANEAVGIRGTGDWFLKDVKAQFFGKDQVSYIVEGEDGTVNSETKNMEIRGNIRMTSSNGYIFLSDRLVFHHVEKTIVSPGPVKMKSDPKVQPGKFELSGSRMKSWMDSNLIHVVGNVKSTREIDETRSVYITSDEAFLSATDRSSRFKDNVKIDSGTSHIEGPEAEFRFDKPSGEVSSLVVTGGAKLKDADRFAESDTAIMLLKEDRYVLRGNPRLTRGGDLLVGEEIVFSRNGRQIQVFGVKGKFMAPKSGDKK